MVFCSNCFKDPEIVSIINRSSHKGTCPICGSSDVSLYDSETNKTLSGIFDNLLSVYTPFDDLPKDYPSDDLYPLSRTLAHDWNIFSDIDEETIIEIVKELSPTVLKDIPSLFSGLVGIAEKYDIEFLRKHSILRTQKWSDFVQAIKHTNRFHTNLINTEILKQYCLYISKHIEVSKQRFYRGRISHSGNGFSRSEMGAPPPDKATDGRANSFGISRLYLTFDRETTLHEIRAAEFDYVTIATFKPTSSLRVVDLKRIGDISPFSPDLDCTALAINREHLQKINSDMARTQRRGDSPLDYLPTQYVCDFIMSIEDADGNHTFDGIEYQSAMRNEGANLAIFYPEKFKCTFCRTYEVTKLIYRRKTIR